MIPNNDKRFVRGKGLVERFGEKRGNELKKKLKAAGIQPEEMDCQGGSAPDDLSFHLRNNKWARKPC